MSGDQKPLVNFFHGMEFAYGSLRNPGFSLRRPLFREPAYGTYGGNAGIATMDSGFYTVLRLNKFLRSTKEY